MHGSSLALSLCESRRHRLLDVLAKERLDAAVITDVRDIYYFTGALLPGDLPAAFIVDIDQRMLIVGPSEQDFAGINLVPYEWNYRGTRHPDPIERMVGELAKTWHPARPLRLGIQRSSLLDVVAKELHQHSEYKLVAVDGQVAAMQQCKDRDEIELIRGSIHANLGAYTAVANTIRPGITELDVLSAGRRGATKTAGEKVFHDGDYQSGTYNGPARERPIKAGDLYIVDAWTCYRGYWSDMSRTFVVGNNPTDIQIALFEHLRWVQTEICKLLRPGIDGKVVYRAMDEMIRQYAPLARDGLIHHGGHSIGLRSHELPDINLSRGGMLAPGNIICLEPGGYFPDARYGVRLENMYLITGDGCEDLCPGEIDLVRCG